MLRRVEIKTSFARVATKFEVLWTKIIIYAHKCDGGFDVGRMI